MLYLSFDGNGVMMTKKQTAEKILFHKNLNYFKENNKYLYDELNAVGETHTKLVFDESGNSDIHFQDGTLYGESIDVFVEKQIQSFMQKIERVTLVPPQSSILDDVGGAFNYNVLKKATDEGLEFSHVPREDDCFFALILGIGLGHHIYPLLEVINAKILILIEPNAEFFYHSCHVFDWEELNEKLEADDREFRIILQNTHQVITHDMKNVIRGIAPSLFDGTVIYRHYNNSVMEVALKNFRANATVVMNGLGFLEDEEFMVRNSFNILKNYEGNVFLEQSGPRKLPCFIVGSGPSLNADIEFLKENQDKAIIVSCGTSLKILIRNGIRPNFHMEMENIEVVEGVLQDVKDEYGLEGITLVASTTVDPSLVKIFDDVVLFFRQSLTSWWIFTLGDWCGMQHVGPTVTNAGLSFAQQIGFREYYLFGVDLGTKDQKKHHAEGSIYESLDIYGGEEFPIVKKGNLGGKVFTHNTFVWGQNTVEQQIRSFSYGRQYYNCSNGLFIKGALPKLSKTIKLSGSASKEKEINEILTNFKPYAYEDFAERWQRTDWLQNNLDVLTELKSFSELEYDAKYVTRNLKKISYLLLPRADDGSTLEENASKNNVRGSVLMALISASFYLARVNDKSKYERMLEIVNEELIIMYEKMDKRMTEFYLTLNDEIPFKNMTQDMEGDA